MQPYPHYLQWKQEPWTSTQTVAMAGSWTWKWPHLSSGLYDTMVPGGSTHHLGLYDTHGRGTPTYSGPQTPTWPLVGICVAFGGNMATDISTDSVCSRTVDPDMALSRSLDQDVITALVSIPGRPDGHGPSGCVALECQQVAAQTPRIFLAFSGNRSHDITTDPDLVGPQTQTWPLATVQSQMTP